MCARRLKLPLCLGSLSWQGSVELGDLAVDEGTQGFFQLIVIPLQFPVVLLLIWSNQGFVLPQGVLAPARKKSRVWTRGGVGMLFLLLKQQSASGRRSASSPLSEVFKAEAQFVVMAKQLRVVRNVGEKDLRHLKGALWWGG